MSIDDDNRFDGIFMTVLQQRGGIANFFNSVFGFLRRQSDFFSDVKKSEQVIIQECKKQFDLFEVDKKRKQKEEEQQKQKEAAKKLEREEKEKQKQEALRKKQEQEQQQQKQQQQQQQQQEQQQQQLEQQLEQQQSKIDIEKVGQDDTVQKEKKDDDEKAPIGNGGKTDKYIWTQTLEELQVYIPIPQGLRAKQLNVDIQSNKLFVQIKGGETIVNGEFFEKIHSDGSVWTVTDGEIQDYKGRYIQVSLEKWKGQMHWWDCVIKGDQKINTQKINPEPSKLNELDGETRGTVEKMMFDMKQKQQGLPTSDELEKKNKLAEFMKQHPEMDFSKCKFN